MHIFNLDLSKNDFLNEENIQDSIINLLNINNKNSQLSDSSIVNILSSILNINNKNSQLSDNNVANILSSILNINNKNSQLSDNNVANILSNILNINNKNSQLYDNNIANILSSILNINNKNSQLSDNNVANILSSILNINNKNSQLSDNNVANILSNILNINNKNKDNQKKCKSNNSNQKKSDNYYNSSQEKNNNDMVNDINLYSGLQRKILEFFCQNLEDLENLVTKKMNLSLIEKNLGNDKNLIKQAIYRCVKKNAISLENIKRGRGGWCTYRLSKEIYKTYIDNNNIDYNDIDYNDIDYNDIDYSPLKEFGFGKNQIRQLKMKSSLSSEDIQNSINHYSWALNDEKRYNELKKSGFATEKNPIKGLMGTMLKGFPWFEFGYKSIEELAIEKSIEAKRIKLENIRKKKEDLLNIEFDIWYEKLSIDDKNKIAKNIGIEDISSIPNSIVKKSYKIYFQQKVI
ncbi:hypothetical protein [Francisella sp. SYW-2]|uniref:hypothetical protein n=1 Tax=Francisella sp. SYW-2 TaxID=2610886 RepID=UPI00123C9DC4|nr:hypothetical protein [Francisella sp. SYW-2]